MASPAKRRLPGHSPIAWCRRRGAVGFGPTRPRPAGCCTSGSLKSPSSRRGDKLLSSGLSLLSPGALHERQRIGCLASTQRRIVTELDPRRIGQCQEADSVAGAAGSRCDLSDGQSAHGYALPVVGPSGGWVVQVVTGLREDQHHVEGSRCLGGPASQFLCQEIGRQAARLFLAETLRAGYRFEYPACRADLAIGAAKAEGVDAPVGCRCPARGRRVGGEPPSLQRGLRIGGDEGVDGLLVRPPGCGVPLGTWNRIERLRVLRLVSAAVGPPPTPKRMIVGMRCPPKVGETDSRAPSAVPSKKPLAQVPFGWLGRWVWIGPWTPSKASITCIGVGA